MNGRYIVFDVETPNSYNNRMSAIGITVVENGEIKDEFYTLVNPEQYFNRFNIQLTRITPEMVENAPTFPELWDKIRPIMESGVLVAHNAPFDIGVLSKCINAYDVDSPMSLKYACTCRMSRKAFPNLPSHRLNNLCNFLNIPLLHHNAGSDSSAAAKLLLECIKNGINPDDFIKTLYI